MAYDYNAEAALESALVALLQAAGLTAGGSRQTDDELGTPRVDVRFDLGAEHDAGTPAAGQTGINWLWDGAFHITIITDRDNNNASHSSYRATVRRVIADSTREDWEAQLGASFRLLELSHTQTTPTIYNQQKALDASAMNYAARVEFISS